MARNPSAQKSAPRKSRAPAPAERAARRVPAQEEGASAGDTRVRILDAAYGVLCEQGYDKLTQLAVCRAANISQGHLTYYFPTRAALQLGLAGHCVYREVEQLVRQMLDAGGTPPRRAEMAAGMAAKLRDRNKPRVMLGLLIAADGDARIKPAVREFIHNARRLIGLAILNFAFDEPDFSASLDQAVPTLLKNWEIVGRNT